MEVFAILMGLISGFVFASIMVILAFMIIFPIYASNGVFVNEPGLLKSGFHLFTTLEPGQTKILERNKKLVRMITNTPDSEFERVGAVDSPDHWKLKVAIGMTEDPTVGVWLPIRWWAKIVYAKTGLVFTGIYPFQKVREYELERTAIERKENPEASRKRSESNLVLVVKHDISDHFRTREFLFPMHITAAETLDKIPLDIIGVAEMSVVNAYKAAYGTDRWDQKVINLVTDAITGVTKTMTLDQALTAADSADVQKIQKAVTDIKDDTKVCGIEISGFKILEINPILDDEGLAAIRAEAIAIQKAKATRIDGSARADALRGINEANKAGGEHSIATMEAEAFVRAAEAAGKNGGSVILMPGNRSGGAMDPTLTAILTELKQLNKKSKGA